MNTKQTYYVLTHHSPPGYDYGCSEEHRHCGVFSTPEQAERWRKELVEKHQYQDEAGIIDPTNPPRVPMKGLDFPKYSKEPDYYFTLLKVEVDMGVLMYEGEMPYATLTIVPTEEGSDAELYPKPGEQAPTESQLPDQSDKGGESEPEKPKKEG